MTYRFYFFKRFVFTFISTSIACALLFSFIEFFEKMMRVEGVHFFDVFNFLALNFVPTLCQKLPLSSWIASFMIIKEMIQKNEFDSLNVMGVQPRTLFNMIALLSIILTVLSFILTEFVAHSLMLKAEKIRVEKFKHRSSHTLLQSWFSLPKSQFVHLDSLDLKTGSGTGLMILSFDSNFSRIKTLSAPHFSLDYQKKNLIAYDAHSIDHHQTKEIVAPKEIFTLPEFFTQLSFEMKIPTIIDLSRILLMDPQRGTTPLHQSLLQQFLSRIFTHFQIFLFATFLFLFFLIPGISLRTRWALGLLLYPLILMLFLMFSPLIASITLVIPLKLGQKSLN